ncbi:MAG: secretin N-terminal domain-containing protein, partial [Thermoguttaceae bacterium]
MRNYQLSLPHGTTIQLAVDQNTNRVHIQGTRSDVDACIRLIEALDAGQPAPGRATRVMTLESASPEAVRRAIGAIQSGNVPAGTSGRMVSMLFQQGEQEEPQPTSPAAEAAAPGAVAPDAADPGVEIPQREGSLIGPVQIEMLEGLDVLVIRGHQRDVEQVIKIIEEIEQLSKETEPLVKIYPLLHTNSSSLAALLAPLYEEVFSPRQGTVSITALVKPNSLLLVGRPESVKTVEDLVKQLDQPVAPETQFRVFRLKHASAYNAQMTLEEFFGGEDAGDFEELAPGLKTRVLATADYRSNSLIVRASPRDMVDVEALIERIDTPESDAINELRVFKLENSLAEDLEPILQEAINDETSGMMGRGGAGGIGATPQGAAAGGGAGGAGSSSMMGIEQKATMLTFTSVDRTGQRELMSGILTGVHIIAAPRTNALIVIAPKN